MIDNTCVCGVCDSCREATYGLAYGTDPKRPKTPCHQQK